MARICISKTLQRDCASSINVLKISKYNFGRIFTIRGKMREWFSWFPCLPSYRVPHKTFFRTVLSWKNWNRKHLLPATEYNKLFYVTFQSILRSGGLAFSTFCATLSKFSRHVSHLQALSNTSVLLYTTIFIHINLRNKILNKRGPGPERRAQLYSLPIYALRYTLLFNPNICIWTLSGILRAIWKTQFGIFSLLMLPVCSEHKKLFQVKEHVTQHLFEIWLMFWKKLYVFELSFQNCFSRTPC